MTINDIAAKAKLSRGTVDRVIHNRGGVSKKNETLINSLIKKYDFKINQAASLLAKTKEYKIVTLIPGNEDVFWESPALGVEKASSKIKMFGFNVINYRFSQTEVNTYLKSFDKLLNEKPDGIILVPAFKKATKSILKKIEAAKIPYIFLNINLNSYNNLSYVGEDSYKSGFLAGKLLHTCLGDKPNFLTVKVAAEFNNEAILNRLKGFDGYFLKEKIETTSVSITFKSVKSKTIVSEKINTILELNPEIEGIFVPSGKVGLIASLVNRKNIKIIGYDTTPLNLKYLNNKKITFLISQKSFNQGFDSIIYMRDFILNKINPKKVNLSPIEIITKENLEFSKQNTIEF